MKINISEKISISKKTPAKPSTIPSIQGGFKNMRKASIFLQSLLSVQFKTGIAVDSLDSIFLNGEGGQFILGNFPSGFL
jgi:hypothetical protein